MSKFLTNEHISLRAPEMSDLTKILKWENDSEQWLNSITLAPYSHQQLTNYIKYYNGDIFAEKQLRLIISLNEKGDESLPKAIGILDLYDFDCKNNFCHIGIYIDSQFRQKGYGEMALTLAGDYVFEMLHIHQLFAFVADDNIESKKLFLKSGYNDIATIPERVRRADKYISAHLFSKIHKQ